MKKYQLLLNGKNFHLDLSEGTKSYGFFTTRWVEAINEKEAELKGVDLICKDQSLSEAVQNPENDPPMIYLEKISELADAFELKTPGEGYTFYREDDKAVS